MHMFDAVWKLGHPTPHREQKKTSPKKRGGKERKKRTQRDWRELFIEILVFSDMYYLTINLELDGSIHDLSNDQNEWIFCISD